MITKELMKNLRNAPRRNLSVNSELTKKRFHEDYYASTYTQRNDAIMLAHVTEGSYKSSANSGSIVIKPLAAFSFIVGTSPYWYTGEADEKEAYTDEIMWRFFCEHDFLYLVRQFKPDSIFETELTADEIAARKAYEQQLDFESAVKLLEALYIQSGYSQNAVDALKDIRTILLSR